MAEPIAILQVWRGDLQDWFTVGVAYTDSMHCRLIQERKYLKPHFATKLIRHKR